MEEPRSPMLSPYISLVGGAEGHLRAEPTNPFLPWSSWLELNQLPRPYQGRIHPYELREHAG